MDINLIQTLEQHFPTIRLPVLRKICKQFHNDYQECFMQASACLANEKNVKQRIKKRMQMPGLKECHCCFEQLPQELMYSCTKGHEFCKKCIRLTIQSTNHEVKCVLIDACGGHFTDDTLMSILTQQEMHAYEQKRMTDVIAELGEDCLSHFCKCAHCNMCMCTDQNMSMPDIKYFECVRCNQKTCATCKSIHHAPVSCAEFALNNQLNDDYIVVCQNKLCGKQLYKDGGCNKLTCVCGKMYCYLCKQMINNNERPYLHFDGGNPCKLYTTDEENRKKFVNQKTTLKSAPMSHVLIGIGKQVAGKLMKFMKSQPSCELVPYELKKLVFDGKYKMLTDMYYFVYTTHELQVIERATDLKIYDIREIYDIENDYSMDVIVIDLYPELDKLPLECIWQSMC